MFRTLVRRQVVAPTTEGTLGFVKLLTGDAADTVWKVHCLNYTTPPRVLKFKSVTIGPPRQRLNVKKENEAWAWEGPPPPGWQPNVGLVYHGPEARANRDGRPYGYTPQAWELTKNNFMDTKTDTQHVFPDDFIRDEAKQRADRKEESQKKREEKRRLRTIQRPARRRDHSE